MDDSFTFGHHFWCFDSDYTIPVYGHTVWRHHRRLFHMVILPTDHYERRILFDRSERDGNDTGILHLPVDWLQHTNVLLFDQLLSQSGKQTGSESTTSCCSTTTPSPGSISYTLIRPCRVFYPI